MLGHLAQNAPTYLTAAAGSGAALASGEVLPDGFFQAITQLLIGIVTVWKLLHDSKKDKQNGEKGN